MKLKLSEILVFKSPTMVNWKATEDLIVLKVTEENPNNRPSEIAMTAGDAYNQVRKIVKRLGVAKLYRAIRDKQA